MTKILKYLPKLLVINVHTRKFKLIQEQFDFK